MEEYFQVHKKLISLVYECLSDKKEIWFEYAFLSDNPWVVLRLFDREWGREFVVTIEENGCISFDSIPINTKNGGIVDKESMYKFLDEASYIFITECQERKHYFKKMGDTKKVNLYDWLYKKAKKYHNIFCKKKGCCGN
jgi:hypothetical protein